MTSQTSFLDVDECTEFNMCKDGICTNTEGGYTCVCRIGYRYNAVTKACEDENECDNNPCVGGTCINKVGSFECNCPVGSIYDSARRLCKGKKGFEYIRMNVKLT